MVFVVPEFYFDNHFIVGPKLYSQRGGLRSKIWSQALINAKSDTHLCAFYKILKFEHPALGLNLGLKAKNLHATRTADFRPYKSTPMSEFGKF